MSDQPNIATIQLNGINKNSLSTRKISKQEAEAIRTRKDEVGDKKYQDNIQLWKSVQSQKKKEERKVT